MSAVTHNEISVPLLQGWSDATQVIIVGPAEKNFRPNVVVSLDVTSKAKNAAEYAAAQLPLLKRNLDHFVLITEGPATIGKMEGFLREQTVEANGQNLGQLQFYIVRGGKAYTFTFTHEVSRFSAARKTAEQIIAGVSFDSARR